MIAGRVTVSTPPPPTGIVIRRLGSAFLFCFASSQVSREPEVGICGFLFSPFFGPGGLLRLCSLLALQPGGILRAPGPLALGLRGLKSFGPRGIVSKALAQCLRQVPELQ